MCKRNGNVTVGMNLVFLSIKALYTRFIVSMLLLLLYGISRLYSVTHNV